MSKRLNASHYDLIVVGSGPGACSAIDGFLSRGRTHRICVVEGGKTYHSWVDEKVRYTGRPLGPGKTRATALGGSSRLWHGVTAPLERVDVDQKWPISFDTLYEFRREALGLLNLEEVESYIFSDSGSVTPSSIFGSEFPDFTIKRFAYSPSPVRLNSFLRNIEPNIDIIVDEYVSEIEILGSGDNEIYSVAVESETGTRNLRAKALILAAGALGTPMILMNSSRSEGSSLSLDLPLLGVGLTDHPMGSFGQLRLKRPFISGLVTDLRVGDFFYRVGFNPAQSLGFKNHNVYLRPSVIANDHSGPLNRLIRFLSIENRLKLAFEVVKETLRSPEIVPFIYKNKISPFPQSFLVADLFTVLEQSFSEKSKITRDKDGQFTINWHISTEDLNEYTNFFEHAGKTFAQALDAEFVPFFYTPGDALDFLVSAAHHTGTARMGDSPQTGVVDQYGKVFGTNAMFVSDASVIPFSGNANTTLTIAAHGERCGRKVYDTFFNKST